MKKLTLVLVAILFAVTGVLAQTPNEFKYQAVLRDASGAIMASEAVTVDIDILQGSASGTSVFTEQHSVTTTAQGLINLNIGSVEDLSVVDFSSDTYFVEISINSTVMGTSQLLSVPYALQAKTAETADYNSLTNLPTLFDGSYNSLTDLPTLFSGDYNDLTNQPTLFDGDYNSLSNLPTLFDGSYNSLTDLPTLFSGDYNDLTNQPTLFDGAFGSLTGTPTTISGYGITDAFSGSYTDLTNKPANATTSTDGFMSSADKTKLDGIATGAEVNVNADWNATTGDAQISNKPTAISDFTMDANSQNVTNLADPVSAKDAANKDYVDALEAQVEIMQNSLIAGGLMVKDYDGNIYGIVEIGTQVWMSENLKVTHYPDGTAIPHVTDNTAWGNLGDNDTDDAYCFYDNNSSSDYGALYTWAAAMGDNAVSSNTNPSGVQGVCPDGWHLPSDDEWTELTDYLGGTSVAGGKMKETGTSHWNSPNTGATNESGFSALPGGNRSYYNGAFGNAGNYGSWWSATESSGSNAWVRSLGYNNAEVNRFDGYKSYGFSVRCIRD